MYIFKKQCLSIFLQSLFRGRALQNATAGNYKREFFNMSRTNICFCYKKQYRSNEVYFFNKSSKSVYNSMCIRFFCDSYTSRKEEENEDELENRKYDELVKRTLRLPDMGHQVFVIQPYVKWGPRKKTITTPDLQLNEAIALIKTLPEWRVVSSKAIPLLTLRKVKMFGKGNLELLTDFITKNKTITAVFISINMLNPAQQNELETIFKVPVFDRYSIVVQIFKLHAVSKEAKLQIAIGEIPYLWSRMKDDDEGMSDKMGGGATVGGPGESYIEIKRRLLQDRERKLKNQLKRLKTQRELMRSKRGKLELPTVAVVGYTNAGKTSLIKVLTNEERLQPKDVLFATLDVTVHAGLMPSGLKVLFVDTVGFLSDIPTNLIESFLATLEDALQADLLIHVQDLSHPDLKAQNHHVMETLKSFSLPENLLQNMITVGNKIDLLSGPLPDMETDFPVSCGTGIGLDVLKMKIESSIIKATGQIFIKIRVPNGGAEVSWLHKQATVVKVTADDNDNQFVFVNTLITEANLNKFKKIFITNIVRRKKN